jgi:hypothetical protein
MVRTFLKVHMELGSYFLFLLEQIKDIIVILLMGISEKKILMAEGAIARAAQRASSEAAL